MCECVKKFNLALREKTGDDDAHIAGLINASAGGKLYPELRYVYRKKKMDGTLAVKKSEGILVPTFCPFCGVRYEKE